MRISNKLLLVPCAASSRAAVRVVLMLVSVRVVILIDAIFVRFVS